MRNKKQLQTFCLETKTVQNFFAKLSANITSGSEKIWINEERNGEISFIVGNERIRMSASSLKKGGLL